MKKGPLWQSLNMLSHNNSCPRRLEVDIAGAVVVSEKINDRPRLSLLAMRRKAVFK